MRFTTKLFALGTLGAAAYGVTRAMRKNRQPIDIHQMFDSSDVHDTSEVRDQNDIIDEPVIITEEVVVITDVAPYEVDVDLFTKNDR